MLLSINQSIWSKIFNNVPTQHQLLLFKHIWPYLDKYTAPSFVLCYLPRTVPVHQLLCMTALLKYRQCYHPPIIQFFSFPTTLLFSSIYEALSAQCLFCLIVSSSLCSLPFCCNVRSSISCVLGLPMHNHLINYTLQGRARRTQVHVHHWSLGLQELFHWSQVKLPTTTPPWPVLCTCGGQGENCPAQWGKEKNQRNWNDLVPLSFHVWHNILESTGN